MEDKAKDLARMEEESSVDSSSGEEDWGPSDDAINDNDDNDYDNDDNQEDNDEEDID